MNPTRNKISGSSASLHFGPNAASNQRHAPSDPDRARPSHSKIISRKLWAYWETLTMNCSIVMAFPSEFSMSRGGGGGLSSFLSQHSRASTMSNATHIRERGTSVTASSARGCFRSTNINRHIGSRSSSESMIWTVDDGASRFHRRRSRALVCKRLSSSRGTS